jgi:ABC-type sugar transport system ATPase subunit
VVLNAGQIEQVGSPMELYRTPQTPFVAGFIGSPKMNLFTGDTATRRQCDIYGIRPEHIDLTAEHGLWHGTVRYLERLGPDAVIYLSVPGLGDLVVRTEGEIGLSPGDSTYATPRADREHRFRGNSRV